WEVTSNGPLGAAGQSILILLRVGAVVTLVATIAAGFVGTSDPSRNGNQSLFWIVFLLGFTYATLLFGDLYSLVNPWHVISGWRGRRNRWSPPLSYPQAAGYWPAFVSYLILIWIELFLQPSPLSLSLVLVAYSVITWLGVFMFGQDVWFQKCDV